MYHDLGVNLSDVDPPEETRSAGRRALCTAGGVLRVWAGSVGPTKASGVYSARMRASGPALLEPVALGVHFHDVDSGG